MARNVGEYAKKMKMGKTLPQKGEVDGDEMPDATLRPKHMIELLKTGGTYDEDGKYVRHEAAKGEDPKYHDAVKAFQTCYEGTKAEDSEDEGEDLKDDDKGEKY